MKDQLQKILAEARAAVQEASNAMQLEEMRVKYSGKKGQLTSVLKQLGTLLAEERPKIGEYANEIRDKIESLITAKKAELEKAETERRLTAEKIDVTMRTKKREAGKRHPISHVISELEEIFVSMGFDVVTGPEIEFAYYNFSALNTPKDHPARDLQDTFYIRKDKNYISDDDIVLRTQTSSVQIRTMENSALPIRMICPGRVFRPDFDASHSPVFHQLEGLVVDKNITMGDLKSTLEVFIEGMFGKGKKIRLRPHHFPFTEPSAEVDISCFVCGGTGENPKGEGICPLCRGEGWIEILGAGMVHPKVLANCGIDPEIYSGFAFGFGLERLVMAKFGIDDIRHLYENDIRFLSQF